MLEEHDQIRLGRYCEQLLADATFQELARICGTNFGMLMLESASAEEREETHRTYLGFKSLLELMQQFVIVKDQIVARAEQKEKKEDE